MKKLCINADDIGSEVSANLFGHFSEHLGYCIYDGIYVGENSPIPNKNGIRTDVAEALKKLEIPVLRWPGGCFADEYHWRGGVGDRAEREKIINTNWGGVTEDNSFGTHEFMELCEQLGCEPYIAGNLGSGSVREMSEWIEYITSDNVSPMTELRRKNGREKPWKLKYFGIGNESWGGGGNMRPDYYADLYRHYQTFCRNYSGNELYKIACGPNADDYDWTEKLMRSLKPWHTKGISLHYYTLPTGNWNKKGDAVEFTEKEYYDTLKNAVYIDEIINRHLEIMSRYDPKNEIALIVDEWGNWFDAEKGTNPAFLFQQNTMRDAVTASYNLNIFISHCDRIAMANIAQMVNVLQAVILTEGEKMLRTPTYFVFDIYRRHKGGRLVHSSCDEAASENGAPLLSHIATVREGRLSLSVTNGDYKNPLELEADTGKFDGEVSSAQILAADEPQAHNSFSGGEKVVLREFDGYERKKNVLRMKLPPCSVVSFTI